MNSLVCRYSLSLIHLRICVKVNDKRVHSFIHSLYRAELGTTSKRFSGQRFPKLHGCLHSRETPQTRLHGSSRYISMIVTDPCVLREEEWKEFRYVVVALMRLLFVSAPRTRVLTLFHATGAVDRQLASRLRSNRFIPGYDNASTGTANAL